MRCPRCGLDMPADFRFCGSCGAALGADETVAREEERKLVSPMFCDLADYTRWSEDRDVEEVERLALEFCDAVRREVERFGGTVEKYAGDAVYALFGAPRAHEDDPERAVHAGLAVVDAMADLRAARRDDDLHVRVGITTGEAFVQVVPRGESRGTAWGDVVNTAARLQSAAPLDGVLVDDATYRATRRLIAYRAVDPVHAKGKARPVPAWQATGPLAHRGLDLATARAASVALVGREAEVDLLERALAEVRERRALRLVTLVGVPGIGKSAVVLELFRRMEAQPDLIHWRHGRSPPYPAQAFSDDAPAGRARSSGAFSEGVAFWALGEIVKAQAGLLESDDRAAAERKLGGAVRALVADPTQAGSIETHLRSLVGIAGPPDRGGDEQRAAFDAWAAFLAALARRRPLVVVFEDVHWADEGLLDFIDHLVDSAGRAPMLVVCTARPELLERRPTWASDGRARRVELGPLSDAQTRALVARHGGGTPLPSATIDAIVEHAAGNALYAVEFVRMLSDRGLLAAPAEAGGDVARDELPVPDSVRSIIAARLDALSPGEKALLQAGAVIGQAVWPAALAQVAGRDRGWCMEQVQALERKHLLAPARRSSVGDEPEYRFAHVLIREVAYRQMLRRHRGELHQRTAAWLESLSPDRAVDRAEMLAHHYWSAYQLARSAGADTAALADPARRALRDAGERALTLHAFPAAAWFFRAAYELWPGDDEERPALLRRLGTSVYYAETRGRDALVEAVDALLAGGDAEAAAEVETLLARLAHQQGRRAQLAEHLQAARERVDGVGPTRARAEVLVELANADAMACEAERAIAEATEALTIARALGEREVEASALAMIGIMRGLTGDPAGRDDLLRSIAIAEDAGSHVVAHCCGMLADLECQLGDLEACFAQQARARGHAARFGHAGYIRWFTAERVAEGYWTGAWDEALGHADGLIAEAEAGNPSFMEAYCRTMRGRIRLGRGDVAGARDDAAHALTFAWGANEPQTLYPALAFAVRAAVVDRSPEAERLADDLLERWRARPDAYPASSWAVDLAYALDALGRGRDVLAAAAEPTVRTRWIEAVVAFADGDYATAAERFARIGSQPDAALARLRAAQGLFAVGRDADARAELDGAMRFYRRAGATPDLRGTETLTKGPVASRPART